MSSYHNSLFGSVSLCDRPSDGNRKLRFGAGYCTHQERGDGTMSQYPDPPKRDICNNLK
jgi:hypothetical protein